MLTGVTAQDGKQFIMRNLISLNIPENK